MRVVTALCLCLLAVVVAPARGEVEDDSTVMDSDLHSILTELTSMATEEGDSRPVVVAVSAPSQDAGCAAQSGYSVSGDPAPIDSGVGFILNPNTDIMGFALHDHVYSSAYVPVPSRAQVTFTFNEAVKVTSVACIEHTNGISEIEGFIGDSVDTLKSIGRVTGSAGTGPFGEKSTSVFTFPTGQALQGKVFRIIVRRTTLRWAWATYRLIPNYVCAKGVKVLACAVH